MRKLLLIPFMAALVQFLVSVPAVAQENDLSLGFTISPAVVDLAAHPGESFSHEISLINTGERPAVGQLVADTLIPIDNILDQGKRSQFDASSWIKIDTPELIFDIGDRRTVKFTISVPESANPGGHYALVTFKPGLIRNTPVGNTVIAPELSAAIFITVAGDIDETAELVEEDLQIGNLTRGADNKLSFRIRNTGNVHILPSPKLSILKAGKPIEQFALKPQLILPNTEKTFTVTWSANVDFGSYDLKAELVYGNQSIPLASTTHSFYVLPSLALISLLVIVAPSLLFTLSKYRNIPRVVQVLRGNAHISSAKNFKRSAGDEKLAMSNIDNKSITDIAKELERQPHIFGLPDDHPTLLDDLTGDTPPGKKPKIVESKAADSTTKTKPGSRTKPKPKMRKTKPSKVIHQTSIERVDTTTFITQTESSTIVREKSPFFDPADIEPVSKPEKAKPKKIAISTNSKVKPDIRTKLAAKDKAAPKKTLKKNTKAKRRKSTAKKAAQKVVTGKTPAKKAGSSKSAPKKKPTAKKSAAKKPASNKPATPRKTVKSSTAKTVATKKKTTGAKKTAKRKSSTANKSTDE